MFYTFRQNNSGGDFDYNYEEGITKTVIIEADSTKDAIKNAKFVGLYFDGCSTGMDCPCCGDRWSDWIDAGTEEPEIYGEKLVDGYVADKCLMNSDAKYGAVVHYKDGKKEWF